MNANTYSFKNNDRKMLNLALKRSLISKCTFVTLQIGKVQIFKVINVESVM